MSAWPSSLPVANVEGYELQPQSGTSRTPMEQGTARVRKIYTRVPTHIPQQWLMDNRQFGLFEWWFKNSISYGAAWFDSTQKNGTGAPLVQCRFIDTGAGPYKAVPKGNGFWLVSATFEVDLMPLGNLVDFWPAGEPSLDLDFVAQSYGVAE